MNALNLTAGTKEKFVYHTVDQLRAVISRSMAIARDQGHCHPVVKGRTYDLKAAYKQFGLCSENRSALRLAAWRPPEQKTILLGLNALLFGAAGSVAGFLRVSLLIWYIGIAAWGCVRHHISTITLFYLDKH